MFRDQIDQVDRLLTIPEVVTKINEVIESETAGANDLYRVIKADPVLSAKILQLVNSAYYGLPGRVGSLEKAIVLLGISAVKNLAVAVSVEQMFEKVKLPAPLTGRDLWRHCLGVAAGARQLAQQAGMVHLEEVFMAGLIHDIGLLAAAQVAKEELQQVAMACASGSHDWSSAELEIFGVTHGEAGARLARKWHFPEYLIEMIEFHHDWPNRPNCSDLTGAVYLADTIVCQLGDGMELTAKKQNIDVEMIERLGLEEKHVNDLWMNLPGYIDELSGLLQV